MAVTGIGLLLLLAVLLACGATAAKQELETAKLGAARVGAERVRGAALLWRAQNPEGCPTLTDLAKEKLLDGSGRPKDPWKRDYVVRCDPGEVRVGSLGPDGEAGSDDDLWVPNAP